MKKQITAITMALCLMTSGCASIISNSNYPVNFIGEDGTPFEIKNESGVKIHKGNTPAVVNLEASNGYFDGAEYTVKSNDNVSQLSSSLDGWYVANILFGGLIGLLIVDPATGAMYKLPESHNVSSD